MKVADPGPAVASPVRWRPTLAALLLGSAVAVNPWTLEWTVVADGRIESVALRAALILLDTALLATAALIVLERDRWLADGALVLGSVAATLIILEIVFRLLGIEPAYPRPRVDTMLRAADGPTERAPHAFVPFSTSRATYASNPRGYFDAGNVIDHVHNSAGWRDVEHELEKPPGTLRVLGLGDSYLYGRGVRYEDVILTRLGRLLDAALPDSLRVETVNTGMPATNTVDQRDLLRDRGWAYEPDLVILFFVPNDVEESLFEDRPRIDFFRNYTAIYQRPDALSRVSRLWGWGRQRFHATYTARRYVRRSIEAFGPDHPGWRSAREALADIQGQARARQVPFLVVIFPFLHELDGDYPFQIVHDTVREYCESVGIDVLDLRDSYRAFRGPELWVHESDQHPNEMGHGIAARVTAQHVLERLGWPGVLAARGGETE